MTAPDTPTSVGWEDEPQRSGAIVAVHYGDYHRQEVWVRSGANIGNWYPLGGEFGTPRELPPHPHWEDVLARGPVTLLVSDQQQAYADGWANGRRRLARQIETLSEEEAPR
jgi:hypothetical protein